jgi:adenine-specific DNA-methyltransferase
VTAGRKNNGIVWLSGIAFPAAQAASLELDRSPDLLESLDLERLRISSTLEAARRDALGQFLTPAAVAKQIAAMSADLAGDVHLLDPGAGIGVLGASLVTRLLTQHSPPTSIALTAFEVDDTMLPSLKRTMEALVEICAAAGIPFRSSVRHEDFLETSAQQLAPSLFAQSTDEFDAVIMNPPYRKIGSNSIERQFSRRIGVETTNIYAAFLAAAVGLTKPDGQVLAIVPRSFANGTYYRPFRKWFTSRMAFRRLHLYESRDSAFADDDVLQENVIFQAAKTPSLPDFVIVTTGTDPHDSDPSYRQVTYNELIRSDDESRVIHIVPDEANQRIADRVASLPASLEDLGIGVSTGRVVDFRAIEFIRAAPDATTVPLIYPGHVRGGRVTWPSIVGRKASALVSSAGSRELLVPEGLYVLTKRFSSKEERRRIVAALYDPAEVSPGPVGFENHLNYFHRTGKGLERDEALGLRAYLNSSLIDLHFRQFSGHTQVNAGDLRRLKYPSEAALRRLGVRASQAGLEQNDLDRIIDEELFAVTGTEKGDPVLVRRRVEEAKRVLVALSFPRAQLNERSALTLLALLDLGPDDAWSASSNPLRGITPMMDYFRDRYGKTYAPNTRETVRRQTVHQFLEAGILVINPDAPTRPTNSPRAVYQIESSTLELLRAFGTEQWDQSLGVFLASRQSLKKRYAAERAMSRIPVTMPDGTKVSLSGGGQNVLVAQVIHEFCPRWTPGGTLLYVGDTDDKFVRFEKKALGVLGVTIERHGKMPDVIIHDHGRGWLILIEAVTSHGPIDGKRRNELTTLFKSSFAPLVFVTAFLDRQAMVKYLPDIAWETEVWCASDPTHLIHFNGERYLGPYYQ